MKVILLIVLIILSAAYAKSDKCRILSFSSGTEKVAYQVGALKALIETLDPEEVQYNVISGVSFGAFNAAIASVHEVGKEKEMIDELYSIWKNTKKIKAYSNWWFGAFQGAFFKGGLYNSAPWAGFVHDTLKGRGAAKMMTLGAVDVVTGKYHDLMDLMTSEELSEAVCAATAVNVFFPPFHAFGTDWFDGAGVWPIEVIGPIKRCQQMGYDEKDIIVDVLMTTTDNLPKRNADNDKTIPSVLRYLEISDFYASVNGITRAIAGFEDINFRYCVNPGDEYLPTNWFPFDFDQKNVDKLLQRGYDDAIKAIQKGEKQTCQNMVIENKNKKMPSPPKELDKLLKGELE